MNKAAGVDQKSLLSKFTITNRGITLNIAYKKPRDMMIDIINKQLQIVNMLKHGFNKKHELFKEHNMFYEHHGRYVVQLRYSNTPLELMDDADSIEVGMVEKVQDVLNAFIALAESWHFNEQINRLAGEWAAKRVGPRGPRKPKSASAEQTA